VLNPHVFRIAPWPGRAPELSARSGQGNWEAYALPAPADRLLPFVLSRTLAPGNSAWVNCATIVDADTEQVLFTLTPTGQTTSAPGPYGLVLAKVVDKVNSTEHFIYTGPRIPNLALPCGRSLRLLLDNEWQSPRFVAYTDLSGFQELEWFHPGPLSGVPYGTGLVQRLYVENGGLQYAAPREVKSSTQDSTSGTQRLDFYAKYRAATTNVSLAPRYLSEAVAAAEVHKFFRVDGEPWRVTGVKETVAGTDGGRWTMQVSLEQEQVLQARLACPPPPLPVLAYDPVADKVRGWRCGDASDTAADFLPTGSVSCELQDGRNTGYALIETKDRNRFSATFGNVQSVRRLDTDSCPMPQRYYSAYYASVAYKNNCPDGQYGTGVALISEEGKFSSLLNKQDATDQAVAWVTANQQANANLLGSCQSDNALETYFPRYDDNGCFTCQMVSNLDPSEVVAATPAQIQAYGRATDNAGNPCPSC
jgi:hypothetical protein